MQHERRDLESLFAPALNQFGTHMLICGLTADIETLERIMSAFTNENKVQRAGTGLLRSILMLDASAQVQNPLAVPGLIQLAPCAVSDWKKQTSLMHAKVALMAFSDSPMAAPTSFRLVMSTGNWTRATWGNGSQIDMYCLIDCLIPEKTWSKEHVNVAAALMFFDKMMSALYPQSLKFLSKFPFVMEWLDGWKEIFVSKRARQGAQFIHSLDKPLFDQIRNKFPKTGISTLVAGSGFFEQPSLGNVGKPTVLTKLEELGKPSVRYLVFNTKNAGALAGWTSANIKKASKGKLDGWTLCAPIDPLQTKPGQGSTNLHAKYIAGLTRVSDMKGTGTISALYIGSGNLSRAGLLTNGALATQSASKRKAGNIEAGFFTEDPSVIKQVWRSLACGDILSEEAMSIVKSGTGEEILIPRDPPPVLFARVANGELELMRSSEEPIALQLRIERVADWQNIDITQNKIKFTCKTIPPIVLIRVLATTCEAESEIFEVPVFSEDGVLCRQQPAELSVDGVLDALITFPFAPSYVPSEEDIEPSEIRRKVSVFASHYSLRLLTSIIEAIAQRNNTLTIEQFPFWLSQLRTLMLEQIADVDRIALSEVGVNLFPVLNQLGFAPPWLESNPQLKTYYERLIADIQSAWTLPDAIELI